jgi:hypothetical protein
MQLFTPEITKRETREEMEKRNVIKMRGKKGLNLYNFWSRVIG